MSFEEIKSEVIAMPVEQQNQLAAFLDHLRDTRSPQFKPETNGETQPTGAIRFIHENGVLVAMNSESFDAVAAIEDLRNERL